MRITRVEVFHCDAGWRPWTFVKVSTDEGLVGWGECSDSRNPHGVAGGVRDFEPLLVGDDPRTIERLYWDMLRAARQNLGGVSHKAIAGIELALWDIKGKALGVPVYECSEVRCAMTCGCTGRIAAPPAHATATRWGCHRCARTTTWWLWAARWSPAVSPRSRRTLCCRATPRRPTSRASRAALVQQTASSASRCWTASSG